MSSAVAVDAGVIYMIPSRKLNIALSVLNLGTQLKKFSNTKEKLPLEIKFGVAKQLEHLPLKLAFNLNKLNEPGKLSDKLEKFSIGGEFNISKYLNLRFGYNNEKRQELKINPSIDLTGFSLGFGVRFSNLAFDYAFTSLGRIGGLHQISLTVAIK